MSAGLRGARIGLTATRRAAAQAALVVALGGEPRHGPCGDVDRPPDEALLAAAGAAAVADPPDVAVFSTGDGARHLLAAARRAGTLDTLVAVLSRAEVVARGVTPRRVLREMGVRVAWTAAPAESDVIRDRLLAAGVVGRRILVQCGGAAPDPMTAALRDAGAHVAEAHPYAVALPADAEAAVALGREAAAGRLDALTFTSVHAVHGFVVVAERAGLDPASLAAAGTLVAAVGPPTRHALHGHGLPVHVEPATPRMGAMFHELAAVLAPRPGLGAPRRAV